MSEQDGEEAIADHGQELEKAIGDAASAIAFKVARVGQTRVTGRTWSRDNVLASRSSSGLGTLLAAYVLAAVIALSLKGSLAIGYVSTVVAVVAIVGALFALFLGSGALATKRRLRAHEELTTFGHERVDLAIDLGRDLTTISELKELADRSIRRCRNHGRVQMGMALAVFGMILCIVAWSLWMVSSGHLTYAAISGTAGVGGFFTAQWKWQPFEKATQSLRLAECLDAHRFVFLDAVRQATKRKGKGRTVAMTQATAAFSLAVKTCGT